MLLVLVLLYLFAAQLGFAPATVFGRPAVIERERVERDRPVEQPAQPAPADDQRGRDGRDGGRR